MRIGLLKSRHIDQIGAATLHLADIEVAGFNDGCVGATAQPLKAANATKAAMESDSLANVDIP